MQIVILLAVLVSCTSRTIYKKPDDLISKKKMIDIWTDIYIAGAAKNVETKTTKQKINYLPLVFEKYGIDSVRFSESNLYYTSKIDDYEKMLQKVNDRLKEMKTMYDPDTPLDSIIRENRKQYDTEERY